MIKSEETLRLLVDPEKKTKNMAVKKVRVQEVILKNNAKRYTLVNNNGFPILPVMKYIKYLMV